MSAAMRGGKTDSRNPVGVGEHFAFVGVNGPDDLIYATVLEVLSDGYRVRMFHPSGPDCVDYVLPNCIEFRLSPGAMDRAKAFGWPQSVSWLKAAQAGLISCSN